MYWHHRETTIEAPVILGYLPTIASVYTEIIYECLSNGPSYVERRAVRQSRTRVGSDFVIRPSSDGFLILSHLSPLVQRRVSSHL